MRIFKVKSDLSDFEPFLTSNWDGDGAQAISAQTLSVARKLIDTVSENIGFPDACPSVTGAIGLVWKFDDNYLYISIRNPKTSKVYRRAPQRAPEDKLIDGYSSDDLVEALIEELLSENNIKVPHMHPIIAHQIYKIFYQLNSPVTYLWKFKNKW